MKKIYSSILLLVAALTTVFSQSTYPEEYYTKQEFEIPMRDGTTLFTQVYSPKDQSKKYPILMKRTCYSVKPYGVDTLPKQLGPSVTLMKEGYIFVYQDVRGRYMSEGTFDNMRPNIPGNKKKDIDESSDTFDTIEWLLKNVKNHNGKVGQWGISYPGFYTAAAIPDAHPALKASSPQAPIGDFFFDDFHHNGALLQSYLRAYPVFGKQKTEKTTESWYKDQMIQDKPADGYSFGLELGPLKNVTETYYKDNFFWNQMVEHPNYDEFWQKRGLIQHMKDVDHSVMTVGGLFDAEDLYGPLNIYKNIEKTSPDAFNILVMGPWSHGDWAREKGIQAVNHICFGDSISTFYQREVEREFFHAILKENRKPNLPEAFIFDTGTKKWNSFDEWPPKSIAPVTLSFHENGKLELNGTPNEDLVFDYVSDPMKPVAYRSVTEGLTFTPRKYMTDDQRHASMRTDVLTFTSDVIDDPVTLAGEINAKLKVALSSTDADFIVKLIDVHPQDHPDYEHNPENIKMGGYQMLVRAEVMRGRFRNSFATPEPFKPGEPTDVNFRLQDVLHTFKKGHKVMIQIHSTWFPYIDRNPQKYVESIYEADEDDFQKSTIQVYGSSVIEVGEDPLEIKLVPGDR
ncbi:MAG: CocE/NonD family hydrolase [bacterium]|nr:CocE/NonD family hydrolase [bacterium]